MQLASDQRLMVSAGGAVNLHTPCHEARDGHFFWCSQSVAGIRIMSDSETPASVSTELAARRTGMSFQRTRLSAERTLMSVIRKSLSMIGFGFTIFQFFEKLKGSGTITHAGAPRNFGLALVLLGNVLGIVYHLNFMLGLRSERYELIDAKLIHGNSSFPVSSVFIIATLLLAIGLLAIVSMTLDIGPFGAHAG